MVALSSDCKPSKTAADNDDIFVSFNRGQKQLRQVETLCFKHQKGNEALILSPAPNNVCLKLENTTPIQTP